MTVLPHRDADGRNLTGRLVPGRSQYITPSALGELLGVTQKTLANWRSEGRGPTFERFGNKIRYFQDQVDAWRDKNRHVSTREYKNSEPSAAKPTTAAIRASVVEQIVALVRQLDALDNTPDEEAGRPLPPAPAERPRGRPRKYQ